MSISPFQTFDPLTGDVPFHPFSTLPDISWRARRLLKPWTAAQIRSSVETIHQAVDEWFHDIKEQEIQRLSAELKAHSGETGAYRFFYEVGTEYGVEWVFDPDREDELDIPTISTISEVDALRECLYWLDNTDGDELPALKGEPWELFAVLSLELLAEAIGFIGRYQAQLVSNCIN